MGLIELELRTDAFADAVRSLVSAAPIPAPTFPALGTDRLVSKLTWQEMSIGAAGLAAPPGALLISAGVEIRHSSIDELAADPNASTTTKATAVLTIAPELDVRFRVDLVRLDVPGQPTASLPAALPLVRQPFTQRQDLGIKQVAAALVANAQEVTLRFATRASDDVFAPPPDRTAALGTDWVVRVSSDVFVEQLLANFDAAIAKLPADTSVEDGPSAEWYERPAFLGGRKGWGAFGGFGVKKRNACNTVVGEVFGEEFYVDVSVAIDAQLFVEPRRDTDDAKLTLVISANASDWDTARCWGGNLGPVLVIAGAASVNPALIGAGFTSLVQIGEVVRMGAEGQIRDQQVAGWTKTSGDGVPATFESTIPLSHMLNFPGLSSATVGPEGLITAGPKSLTPPLDHTVRWYPDLDLLEGFWESGYSCSRMDWGQRYTWPSVGISDTTPLGGNKVTVFPTSTCRPAADWWLVDAKSGFPGSVGIDGRESAQTDGRAFIHTSAGLRRYDLARVGEPPPPIPDPLIIALHEINCRNFGRAWINPRIKLEWLVDPPPVDLGMRPLRQWMLIIEELPAGTSLRLRETRGDEELLDVVAAVELREASPVVMECVTDLETELILEHGLAEPPNGARLQQRWLIPVGAIDLPEAPTRLRRAGTGVQVVAGERSYEFQATVGRVALDDDAPAAEPFTDGSRLSVTMRNGQVAALHGNQLVFCLPMDSE